MSTDFEERLSRIRNNEPTLANREEHAVELGVILPLLSWAGWDTGDLTQIYPQRPLSTLSNTGKVDFDLQNQRQEQGIHRGQALESLSRRG